MTALTQQEKKRERERFKKQRQRKRQRANTTQHNARKARNSMRMKSSRAAMPEEQRACLREVDRLQNARGLRAEGSLTHLCDCFILGT